jgi:glutamine synthetase
VLLKPVRIFPDPFRGAPNILVLCECIAPDHTPIPSNTRRDAFESFNKALQEKPWFGLEQEYTLFHADKVTPLGWPKGGFPGPQGPYYCAVGTENSFGRLVVEAHYRACLYAGITISGVNGEVLPGQWEYQIGPCVGIESGDHCWMARYLMYRVCEDFGVCVSFDPKPIPGDWNGSGMHSNYSTEAMRQVRLSHSPPCSSAAGRHLALLSQSAHPSHPTPSLSLFLSLARAAGGRLHCHHLCH